MFLLLQEVPVTCEEGKAEGEPRPCSCFGFISADLDRDEIGFSSLFLRPAGTQTAASAPLFHSRTSQSLNLMCCFCCFVDFFPWLNVLENELYAENASVEEGCEEALWKCIQTKKKSSDFLFFFGGGGQRSACVPLICGVYVCQVKKENR